MHGAPVELESLQTPRRHACSDAFMEAEGLFAVAGLVGGRFAYVL